MGVKRIVLRCVGNKKLKSKFKSFFFLQSRVSNVILNTGITNDNWNPYKRWQFCCCFFTGNLQLSIVYYRYERPPGRWELAAALQNNRHRFNMGGMPRVRVIAVTPHPDEVSRRRRYHLSGVNTYRPFHGNAPSPAGRQTPSLFPSLVARIVARPNRAVRVPRHRLARVYTRSYRA